MFNSGILMSEEASMTITIVTLLFLLFCGHAIADFALQTTWIAIHKNRHSKDNLLPGEQEMEPTVWPWVLTAHSLHHGLMVYLITRSIVLGLSETIVHWVTDFGKSEKWYGFHVDQILHLVAKVVWVVLIYKQVV
jgi:hypothetical protein